MQYNNHPQHLDLCTLANKRSKQNDASFDIAEKTLYANLSLRSILSWIMLAYGGWIYDDRNYTDLPEATNKLISGQVQYTFPINSEDIMGVSTMDSSGFWRQLKPITLEQIQERCAEDQFMNVAGFPTFYRLVANGVKLYPAPNYTLDNAIKIYISRDVVQFETTDTDKEPGFDNSFHEAVAIGMAKTKAETEGLNNAVTLRKEWSNESDGNYPPGFEQRIKKHYAMRFRQQFPQRLRTRDEAKDYIS